MNIDISKAEKISAKIVSYIFHPLFFPTLGLYFILNSGTYLDTMNSDAKYFLYVMLGFSTCILPLLSLPIFMYRRLIKNIEMENRSERVLPLIFIVFFYFIGYYMLARLPLHLILISYFTAVTGMAAVTLFITIWWKISFHMIGAGGLLGSVLALSLRLDTGLQMYLSFIILLVGIVATSRLLLKAHTPAQIVVGFFTGFTGVFLWMFLF